MQISNLNASPRLFQDLHPPYSPSFYKPYLDTLDYQLARVHSIPSDMKFERQLPDDTILISTQDEL